MTDAADSKAAAVQCHGLPSCGKGDAGKPVGDAGKGSGTEAGTADADG